jgi:hypothetical protein
MSRRRARAGGAGDVPTTFPRPALGDPSEGKAARPVERENPWRLLGLVGALAALVAMAHYRVLFLGETFVERDALRFTLPSREFLAASLRAGRLPEWFDGVNFGSAFAANPAHEALAPLGWTFAFLPMPFGSDLYSIVLVLVGGLGTAALSRRLGASPAGSLLAGAAVALGGYVTSMVQNGLVPCPPWTPWVAWAADRLASTVSNGRAQRRGATTAAVAVLAATLALQLHAGEPASLLIAGALAWAFLLVRATRPLLATVLALAAALAAVLLAASAALPGFLLLSESARGAGLDRGGLDWSLHPARLLETVWPMAFGSQRVDGWLAGLLLRDGPGDPFWSYSLFVGLPVLLCAAAGAAERGVRRLLLASAPFLLVAAGRYTPLYSFLGDLLPPLRLVNFPEKFVYGALLLWAVAAGVGFSRLFAVGAAPRFRGVAVGGAAGLGLGLVLVLLGRGALNSAAARRASEWGALINTDAGVSAAIQGGAVAVAGAALFALALALRGRAPRGSAALALLAALAPLVVSSALTSPLAPRSAISVTPAVLRTIAPAARGPDAYPRQRLFRIDPVRLSGPFRSGAEIARDYNESLDTNIAARFGLAVVGGFEPAESVRSRRFGREVFPRMSLGAFAILTGVSWIVAQDPEKQGLPFPVVARGEDGWTLLGAGLVRPRAFVSPRWRVVATPEEALGDLAAPGRESDPGTIALAGVRPPLRVSAAPITPCAVLAKRPEEVTLDCTSSDGGFAVLLDEWAPGWSATADGRVEKVHVADGLFRAVPVGPGQHQVVFSYRTPGLRVGILVSLVAWLAWGALLIWSRTRAR